MLMRPAMLNFICQFDWTIIYPDIWLNIIFGVCLWGCLWEKLASEFVNWVSRWTLPIVGGCHLIHLGLNRIKRSRKFDVLLPTCWTKTLVLLLSVPLVLRPADVCWSRHYQSLLWLPHLQIIPPVVPGQLCPNRITVVEDANMAHFYLPSGSMVIL